MEVITIESTAYQELINRIGKIEQMLLKKQRKEIEKLDRLLSREEVLDLLNISNRTLQRMRTSGKISYVVFGKTIRYSQRQLENLIHDNMYSNTPQNLDDLKRNYSLKLSPNE